MRRFSLSVLIVFVSIVAAEATWNSLKFTNCGSVEADVKDVAVNCSVNDDTAQLKKGTYVQLKIDMTSKEISKKLKAVVHGYIGETAIPFPLPNPDGCKGSNINCPVQSGKTYDYEPVIYVNPFYPKLKLIVKWELRDDNKKDLICIAVKAVIV